MSEEMQTCLKNGSIKAVLGVFAIDEEHKTKGVREKRASLIFLLTPHQTDDAGVCASKWKMAELSALISRFSDV